jgi:hypothetical protein
VIDGTHNVGSKNLSSTTSTVKGSNSFSSPLIISTSGGGASIHWLYFYYATLIVANFTIYPTFYVYYRLKMAVFHL